VAAIEAAKAQDAPDDQMNEPDLMIFTPQAAATDKRAADQPGQVPAADKQAVAKTSKQSGRQPWWSGRLWRNGCHRA